MCRLGKLKLEFINELILVWLVEEDKSCKPENVEPDDPEANNPKREGKLRGWRWWVSLSDNLSPPHASGGVPEESSLLEAGDGVDPPNNVKEDRVSSCTKRCRKRHNVSLKT